MVKKYLYTGREFEINFVLKKIDVMLETEVLDFGSGDGFSISKFKEYGLHNVSGIDVYDSNYNSKDNEIIYYSGKLDDFPMLKKYDLIFSSNVLEHLTSPAQYIELFDSLLNESGFQVHIVPTHYWKFWNSFFYYYSVLKLILKKIFKTKKKFKKNSYKNKVNLKLKQSPFFIGRHGSRGTSFDEFKLFNPKSYKNIIVNSGFDFEDFPIPIIYSGHKFLGNFIPIKFRSLLTKFFGYSCHCFIIKKK